MFALVRLVLGVQRQKVTDAAQEFVFSLRWRQLSLTRSQRGFRTPKRYCISCVETATRRPGHRLHSIGSRPRPVVMIECHYSILLLPLI